jgi:hypothetical protein
VVRRGAAGAQGKRRRRVARRLAEEEAAGLGGEPSGPLRLVVWQDSITTVLPRTCRLYLQSLWARFLTPRFVV